MPITASSQGLRAIRSVNKRMGQLLVKVDRELGTTAVRSLLLSCCACPKSLAKVDDKAMIPLILRLISAGADVNFSSAVRALRPYAPRN